LNHEKLKAQAQETTRMLVKAIAADYGISEVDAALVLAQVEYESLWGREALEEALKKVLSPNEDPKRQSE